MGDRERLVAVAHADAGREQRRARELVVAGAVAPGGIEHDANIHTATPGGDHRVEQGRIGEQEHPDVQAVPGGLEWDR